MIMNNIDFPFLLLTFTVISGLIILADKIYCHYVYRNHNKETPKDPFLVDYSKAFFLILLVVFCIRSFLYEPFRVPTSSLVPTILPGDFIMTNKYAFGVKFPIWEYEFIKVGLPKRGDIVIFKTPVDNTTWLIKRVIGVPGDVITYADKKLTINNQPLEYKFLKKTEYVDERGNVYLMDEYQEDLFGVKHKIYDIAENNLMPSSFKDLKVPKDHYFVMGDNRDNSDDSRFWGFLPIKNIEGKALFVIVGLNPNSWFDFRWDRIGSKFYISDDKK